MMGPDYTHWQGTREIARNSYNEMVPELGELVHKGKSRGDPEQVPDALAAKLHDVLN